jgi:MFS family permease
VGKLPVAIPQLRSELTLTLVEAGFMLSLVQLAGMLLGLSVGLLSDRLGPATVMRAGLMLLGAGSALGAVAPSVTWLLVTRVVEGAGFLLAVLPAPGLMRLHVAPQAALSRALGWWGTYMPLGTALALLLGGWLMGWVGWRTVWLALALVSMGAALLLHLKVPTKATPGAGRPSELLARLRRTLRAPGPWLVALAFFMYSGQWLAVIGFLPTIHGGLGWGAGSVAVLGACAAAVNMGGNVMAGRLLAQGRAPGRVMVFAFGSMALGAVCAFGAEGHPVAQYLGVLVFSGVGGLVPGTLFGVAVAMAPGNDTVSTTVGWMQQFSSLGQLVGPPAVAWMVTLTGGWQSTWVLTGACSLAGAAISLRLQQVWDTRLPARST